MPVKLKERKLQRDLPNKEIKAGITLKGWAYCGADLIEVDPRLSEEERLSTIIHESTHIAEDKHGLELTEATIETLSEVAAKVLWEDGWRRVRLK